MSLIHPKAHSFTGRRTFSLALLTLIASSAGWAAPVTHPQARTAVSGWFKVSRTAMAHTMERQITSLEIQRDKDGKVLFYVANLAPKGFVVLSPDDLLEPVVVFSPSGHFEATPENPLYDFLVSDMQDRLNSLPRTTPGIETSSVSLSGSQSAIHERNKSKWALFLNEPQNIEMSEMAGSPSVDDPRVDPLTLSKWSQQTGGGGTCYNYYTPNGYPCGCVATAMSQIMRFFQHPASGIGVHAFDIQVNGSTQSASTRGGDGSGGAYDWSNMPLVPPASTPEAQRAMIGALCSDAGISVNMSYKSTGSGTDTLVAANSFKNTFQYANAIKGFNDGNEMTGATFNAMVNTNLDAGQPVQLGITGTGGHSIVCDGYGYNTGTSYHHLNMGWAGSDDAWYNLPNIGTKYNFNKVYKVIYNIFPTGNGEILSGRVIDASSNPIEGVQIDAGGYSATTNARGIYAIPHIPAGTYEVQATKPNYSFTPQTNKVVGTSLDESMTTGNLWGIDFTGTSGCTSPAITSNPLSQTIGAGQTATLGVVATQATAYQWYLGNSGSTAQPISGATSATYTTAAITATTSYWVRVSNDCGFTDSATATVSIGQPELIQNGGFEIGTSPWAGNTTVIGSWANQPPYEGSRCARMLGIGKTTTQTLYQTVTIPSNAASATLNFYLHIDTAEVTTSRIYDRLVVSIRDASGANPQTLATFTNLNKAPGYALRTFDLSPFKGQTVQVHFNASEDVSLQTSFVLDNVSLTWK